MIKIDFVRSKAISQPVIPNKEIAAELNLTEPNVRQLQVRALKKLHKYFTLQSYYDE